MTAPFAPAAALGFGFVVRQVVDRIHAWDDADPSTGFTNTDAAELLTFVRGGYSPEAVAASRPFWTSAVADYLAESGCDAGTAATVAPVVMERLDALRSLNVARR